MKHKIKNFQILRLLAASLVLVSHISLYIRDRLNPNQQILDFGKLGVVIFFCLSGTIMQLNYYEKKISWTDFIKARLIRIIPLYWCALICKITIFLIFPSLIMHSEINLLKIIKSILLIPDQNSDGIQPILGVAWTLYFETLFYFIFSIYIISLTKFAKINAKIRKPGYVLEFLLLGIASLSIAGAHMALAIYGSSYLIFFYIGVSLARYFSEGFVSVKRYKMFYFGLICLSIFLFQRQDLNLNPLKLLIYSFVSIALVSVSFRKSKVNLKFVGNYLSNLGDASYSLYLFHPLVAPLVPEICAKFFPNCNTLLVFLITFSVSIWITFYVHKFVEKPILKTFRSIL